MARTTTLLKTGITGAVIAALCCFTPVLVILVGAVGLSAVTGYLDYVLLPALAFFVALTGYALHRRRQEQWLCKPGPGSDDEPPGHQ